VINTKVISWPWIRWCQLCHYVTCLSWWSEFLLSFSSILSKMFILHNWFDLGYFSMYLGQSTRLFILPSSQYHINWNTVIGKSKFRYFLSDGGNTHMADKWIITRIIKTEFPWIYKEEGVVWMRYALLCPNLDAISSKLYLFLPRMEFNRFRTDCDICPISSDVTV